MRRQIINQEGSLQLFKNQLELFYDLLNKASNPMFKYLMQKVVVFR